MRTSGWVVLICAAGASGCLCNGIPDLSGDYDAGADGGGIDSGPSCPPDAGGLPAPIAYWSLDEGSGVAVHDGTGNGNVGTLGDLSTDGGGDFPTWGPGAYCGGLHFRGDGGYVEFGFGSGGAFSLTGSLTVSAWYAYDALPPDMQDMPILSKRGGFPRGWEMYLDGSDGSAVFDVAQDAGSYQRQYGDATAAHTWHHLVGVFDADGGALWLYQDGTPHGPTLTGMNGQFDSPWTVHLGLAGSCVAAPCPRAFNGSVDEVRVWNVALTPAQVQQVP